jgi:predicted outer membrane protein
VSDIYRGVTVTSNRRRRARLVQGFVALFAATAALGATIAPAQAADYDPGAAAAAATAQPLTALDHELVVKVRLAGLWEGPAGRMAATKGSAPRVREIGAMIAAQHTQLDALDEAAAAKLKITLPTKPTDEQQSWLDEMTSATGPAFDDIFVARLRAAHGKIFPVIDFVRSTTQNDVVRTLAQQANGFVLNHLTYLESTGLVNYQELPAVAAPIAGPIAKATVRSQNGGIAVPLIWLILAVSLVGGAGAAFKVLRPASFGSRRAPLADPVPVYREPVARYEDEQYEQYPSMYPPRR